MFVTESRRTRRVDTDIGEHLQIHTRFCCWWYVFEFVTYTLDCKVKNCLYTVRENLFTGNTVNGF